METSHPLTDWAAQLAATVRQKAQAQERHRQAALLDQAQAEQAWVNGIAQVVQTLETLVQALRQTGQFPQLTLLHARGPQDISPSLRRGMLLRLTGLGPTGPTVAFELDTTPPFRPDLLTPTVRVLTTPDPAQPSVSYEEQLRIGVSLQGTVVWQEQNPSLLLPPEGTVDELLRRFLAAMVRSA